MKLATGDAGCARFASAGLGECDNLFLWDAQRATAVVDFGRSSGVSGGESTDLVVDLEGQKESAYALAIDDAGNTLVSGCTGNVLRVWDGRTGARICAPGPFRQRPVRGASGDGRLCLTGSSDHTLRLWDLGQQRCCRRCIKCTTARCGASPWTPAGTSATRAAPTAASTPPTWRTGDPRCSSRRRRASCRSPSIPTIPLPATASGRARWDAGSEGGDATWTGGTTSTRSRRGTGEAPYPGIDSGRTRTRRCRCPRNSRRAGRLGANEQRVGARTRAGRAPTRSTAPPRRRSSPPRPSSNTFKRRTGRASSPPTPTAPSRCGTSSNASAFDASSAARPSRRRQGGEPASLGALVVHGGHQIGVHRDFADAIRSVPGGGVRVDLASPRRTTSSR